MAKIALEKIVIDETIYPRSGVSEFNTNRLVAAIRTKVKLPPIVVEAKTYRLVDGRHRYEAYRHEGLKTIEVIEKVYATEADLFADAVRANIGHGEPLDQYTVRSAIIRLTEYGYSKDKISEVVRLPVEQIDKIERGFATDADTGKPIALKGGLSHLRGQAITQQQQEINKRYSGPKALFHLRQIIGLLENDMWPQTESFVGDMDKLVDLWLEIRKKAAAA